MLDEEFERERLEVCWVVIWPFVAVSAVSTLAEEIERFVEEVC